MKFHRSSTFTFALLLTTPLFMAAQDSAPLAHHVSGNAPVQASPSSRTLSAERPSVPPVSSAPPLANPPAHNWQLQATLPGTIIHDMTFTSPSIGYAVAEGGQVWKTTNGGKAWSEIFNL
ncbi:MAG: hypothetical protein WA853_08750, partial [Candidatus Acidiferrum sp.]